MNAASSNRHRRGFLHSQSINKQNINVWHAMPWHHSQFTGTRNTFALHFVALLDMFRHVSHIIRTRPEQKHNDKQRSHMFTLRRQHQRKASTVRSTYAHSLRQCTYTGAINKCLDILSKKYSHHGQCVRRYCQHGCDQHGFGVLSLIFRTYDLRDYIWMGIFHLRMIFELPVVLFVFSVTQASQIFTFGCAIIILSAADQGRCAHIFNHFLFENNEH